MNDPTPPAGTLPTEAPLCPAKLEHSDQARTQWVAANAILLLFIWVVLVFVAPVFGAMYAEQNNPSAGPTQFAIDLAVFIKRWWWLFGPAGVLGFGLGLISAEARLGPEVIVRLLRLVFGLQLMLLVALIGAIFFPML